MTCEGICENLVSDCLFLLILVVLGSLWLFVSRRWRLLRFFRVGKSRRITIYLSNLRVTPGGAVGVDDRRRAYEGIATSFAEMQAANRFRRLFDYPVPALSDQPGILRNLLISDVQVQVLPSPTEQGQPERACSFITLGSPAYNTASSFVETELQSKVKFKIGQAKSSPVQGAPAGDLPSRRGSSGEAIVELGPCFSPSVKSSATVDRSSTSFRVQPGEDAAGISVQGGRKITDETYCFVERIVDREQGRSVFYVAGISELGTAGAAYFLATEWDRTCRKYGRDAPFTVVLRIEPTDFTKWTIVGVR